MKITEQKMIKPFYLDLNKGEIEDIQAKMGEILHSGQLILGKYTQQFEDEFAAYIGTKYAVSFNTCTSALQVLMTLKNVKGKKVAVPSNTNFASVAAIIHQGGIPVFMDMTKEYFVPNLDILKYTKEKYNIHGVMWVHIGGIIAPDFHEVAEYCKKNNLFLIEDCAHAHGSQLGDVKAGNFADGGAFSFFPTKVMTTMEGGMITTNNKEEADLMKSFRNQGKRHAAYGGLHYDLGYSWRLSEIAAYMGLVQLAKLDRMIGTRDNAVKKIAKSLDKIGVEYCDTSHMTKASQYKFLVVLKEGLDSEKIKKTLKEEYGVACGGAVYNVPCHLQPVFENIEFTQEEVANTQKYCPQHICPPITSGTTEEDIVRISEALTGVLQ